MNALSVVYAEHNTQRIVIVPFNKAFGQRSPSDQRKVLFALQVCCDLSPLKGKAVVAWLDDSGVKFLFDTSYIAKLPAMTWSEVFGRLNRRLKCDDRFILDQLSEYATPQQLLVAPRRPKADSPSNFRNGRIADYNYQPANSAFFAGRQEQPSR